MSKLIFVRHGQASFFSDDYDKLSPRGEDQARALAGYWLDREVTVDAVYTGTLERQKRTAAVLGEAYQEAGEDWPELKVVPALNEYPADDIMGILLPELAERDERIRRLKTEADGATEATERYKTFHRLLEAVFTEWVRGKYESNGFMRWEEFRDTVRAAIQDITNIEERGKTIVVSSSGGVIGVAVQTVLGAPDIKAGELNWRIHNCSLTEFTFSRHRITLDTFNAVPHLTDPNLLTYR